jgi:hypothetical protein
MNNYISANLPNGNMIYFSGLDSFCYSDSELTILSDLKVGGTNINEYDASYREYIVIMLQESHDLLDE